MNKTVIGLLCGISAASIWGGMYVVSKVVLDVIPPFALLTLRLVLGGLALWSVILYRGGSRPSRENFRNSFLVGIVGYGISLGFQFVGTKLSTASNGALVTAATPAFVFVFAPFLLGESTTRRGMISLILSSLGVVVVIDPRNADFSSSLFLGNISLLMAAITWALYSVLVRKLSKNFDLLVSSTIMLAGGIPSSLIIGFNEFKTQGIGEISPGIIGGVLYLGLISTALAMFLWNYAFSLLPASSASLTFFAQPVVGSILGWLLLGEKVTPLFIFGGLLIGIGVFISSFRNS